MQGDTQGFANINNPIRIKKGGLYSCSTKARAVALNVKTILELFISQTYAYFDCMENLRLRLKRQEQKRDLSRQRIGFSGKKHM